MTDAERQKVIEAIRPLDQFAKDGVSGMNTSTAWHVRWQQVWDHAGLAIGELVTKPDKPKKR